MIQKFRKKPVVIEAVQLTPNTIKQAYEFIYGSPDDLKSKWDEYCEKVAVKGLMISTIGGETNAQMGDYIIKGVLGGFYTCEPEIFEKTYEPAD